MGKETTEIVQELAKAYLDHNKINRLTNLLNELKEYKNSLTEKNIRSFESVIAKLADNLPEEYSYKIKSLNYFSDIEENNDLPF